MTAPVDSAGEQVDAAREQVAAACRRLAAAGLVPGTSGNVSARAGHAVAVTATGLGLAEATAEGISVVGLDGTLLAGRYEATSELPLHLAVYARYPAGAIVHTHAPASTAVSCLVEEVPPIHYATLSFGGPVHVAPFATFGTPELAEAVVAALADRKGALMANHGAITWSGDLAQAVELTAVLEWLCEVYLRAAAAGTPRVLTGAQLDAVARAMRLRSYGTVRPAQTQPE